ncbi:hypothetical protein A2U01_0019907, partial [Trifolium medium]|nr:hypothetical protein [Trifolium medium]
MIVCSWNVRGLREGLKRRRITNLIKNENVEILALQETKLESVDNNFCPRLWGGDNVGWCCGSSVGRSGGLLTMWDKNKGDFILSFQGQGYMGVLLEWGREKKKYVILNVYAPCGLNGKKRLWVDILVAKQSVAAEFWCVLGDFNSIRGPEERQRGSGSMFYPGVSEDSMWFNIFLQRLGLSDLPLFGRKFTWVQPNGGCMSRLDRIMVSFNWLEEWGDTNLWALSRDVSDHCPIIL